MLTSGIYYCRAWRGENLQDFWFLTPGYLPDSGLRSPSQFSCKHSWIWKFELLVKWLRIRIKENGLVSEKKKHGKSFSSIIFGYKPYCTSVDWRWRSSSWREGPGYRRYPVLWAASRHPSPQTFSVSWVRLNEVMIYHVFGDTILRSHLWRRRKFNNLRHMNPMPIHQAVFYFKPIGTFIYSYWEPTNN